jgi:hypothetical protein
LASSILDAVKIVFEIGMHTLCHLEALSLSLCMVAVKKDNISKTVENFFSTNVTGLQQNEVTLKE